MDGQVSRILEGQVLDEFDMVQLKRVLEVIAETSSMEKTGRQLFAVTRASKNSFNDSDRVKKFLARWNLDYKSVKGSLLA